MSTPAAHLPACPFCGSAAALNTKYKNNAVVSCPDTGCQGHTSDYALDFDNAGFDTAEEAIAAWSRRAALASDASHLEGLGALAIGPERDGKTPYLYAPMADLDEIAKAIHAWRNPPAIGTDAEGHRTVTFSTGKTAKWSGEAEVLKLTDDGYRIRFSWVSGGPVNAAEYDGELWADYKQCNLPGPAADIADYLMTVSKKGGAA